MRSIRFTLITILYCFFGITLLNAQSQNFEKAKISFLTPEIDKKGENGFFAKEILGVHNAKVYYIDLGVNDVIPKSPFNIVLGKNNPPRLSILENGEFVYSQEIPLLHEGKTLKLEQGVLLQGSLHTLLSFDNKEHKKIYLFKQAFDLKNQLFSKELIKIAEIDYSNYHKKEISSFSFIYSPDKNSLLVIYDIKSKENIVLSSGMLLLNSQLNQVWQRPKYIRENTDNLFSFNRIILDNSGDVVIIGKAYPNKKEFDKDHVFKPSGITRQTKSITAEFDTKIYLITNNGKDENAMYLGNDNLKAFYASAAINDKNELVIAGLGGWRGSRSVTHAFAYTLQKKDLKILSEKYHKLDAEFLAKGKYTPSNAKTIEGNIAKGKDFDNGKYDIEPIQIQKDGSFYVLAEAWMIVQTNFGNTVSFNKEFADLSILVFDADNNIKWKHRIEKSMLGNNYYLLDYSYGYFFKDGNLNIVHSYVAPGGFLIKSNDLAKYTFDRNGRFELVSISTSVHKMTFSTADTYQTSTGTLLMNVTTNSNKYVLAEVK